MLAEFFVSIVKHRCKVMMALFNEKVLKNEIATNKMILYPTDIEEYSQNEMQINKDPGIYFTYYTSLCIRCLLFFLSFLIRYHGRS